jgi:hypothetical protein
MLARTDQRRLPGIGVVRHQAREARDRLAVVAARLQPAAFRHPCQREGIGLAVQYRAIEGGDLCVFGRGILGYAVVERFILVVRRPVRRFLAHCDRGQRPCGQRLGAGIAAPGQLRRGVGENPFLRIDVPLVDVVVGPVAQRNCLVEDRRRDLVLEDEPGQRQAATA